MRAYRAAVLADSPRGYWPLDDWDRTGGAQPGQARDHSGNNIHSVDWANIARTPGVIPGQSAGRFNGSTSGMTIPGSGLLDVTNLLTIEAWIRPEQTADFNYDYPAQNGFVFEKTTNGQVNTQYSLFQEGNNVCFRTYHSGGGDSLYVNAGGLRLSRWNHLAATWDGATKRVYYGGVQYGAVGYAPASLVTNSAGTSFIGCFGTGGYRFKGDIAHVAVYASSLSQARLQAHIAAAGQDAVSY